jgi:Flp pilus assembly protein TadB
MPEEYDSLQGDGRKLVLDDWSFHSLTVNLNWITYLVLAIAILLILLVVLIIRLIVRRRRRKRR